MVVLYCTLHFFKQSKKFPYTLEFCTILPLTTNKKALKRQWYPQSSYKKNAILYWGLGTCDLFRIGIVLCIHSTLVISFTHNATNGTHLLVAPGTKTIWSRRLKVIDRGTQTRMHRHFPTPNAQDATPKHRALGPDDMGGCLGKLYKHQFIQTGACSFPRQPTMCSYLWLGGKSLVNDTKWAHKGSQVPQPNVPLHSLL